MRASLSSRPPSPPPPFASRDSGPTFAARSGATERAQPLLHVRLPSFEKQRLARLRGNAGQYVTAFDVHATVLDVLLAEEAPASQAPKLGMSLVSPLPKSRHQCRTTRAVPPEFCPLEPVRNAQCKFMVGPPSVFSFYSDIPPKNRPRWPAGCPAQRDHAAADPAIPCSCATATRSWYDCSNATRREFRAGLATAPEEHFALRACGHHDLDQSLELDLHLTRNGAKAAKAREKASKAFARLADGRGAEDAEGPQVPAFAAGEATAAAAKSYNEEERERPNILFLEIDSVSLAASERFFPRTWGLLQEHKIVTEGQRRSCPTGWCAGMFNKTSVGE